MAGLCFRQCFTGKFGEPGIFHGKDTTSGHARRHKDKEKEELGVKVRKEVRKRRKRLSKEIGSVPGAEM